MLEGIKFSNYVLKVHIKSICDEIENCLKLKKLNDENSEGVDTFNENLLKIYRENVFILESSKKYY